MKPIVLNDALYNNYSSKANNSSEIRFLSSYSPQEVPFILFHLLSLPSLPHHSIPLHSFIHSGYLYSAPSRTLLRGDLSPATVKEKCLKKIADRRQIVLT